MNVDPSNGCVPPAPPPAPPPPASQQTINDAFNVKEEPEKLIQLTNAAVTAASTLADISSVLSQPQQQQQYGSTMNVDPSNGCVPPAPPPAPPPPASQQALNDAFNVKEEPEKLIQLTNAAVTAGSTLADISSVLSQPQQHQQQFRNFNDSNLVSSNAAYGGNGASLLGLRATYR
ncbi:unnamed protein product [Gongylonema pulchrum]|uniref:Uncharacterized protein n=1 Tax=Gongylonema pulchrum TaxID=637853 RepID=A0A183DTH0_9BILA|nr:unnamed protein product [Gongylonema pulchrum]